MVEKVTDNEHVFKLNSHFRSLQDRINNQNATLHNQQSELIKLCQTIVNLSHTFYQLKLAVNLSAHSPVVHSRPNSTDNCINNDYNHEYLNINSSRTPQANHTLITSPTQIKSFDYLDTRNSVEHFSDALNKTTAALERRDIENQILKRQIEELQCTGPFPIKIYLMYQHHY